MGIKNAKSARDLLVDVLLPEWRKNRARVDELDKWYRGKHPTPVMPRRPTREFRELQDKSRTPWLGLVVSAVAQSLFVEGYRNSSQSEQSEVWEVWQQNGMDARQIAVHRAALAHGVSYLTVLPGIPVPVMRGVSARKMITLYADPAEDEFPIYGLRGDHLVGSKWRWRLYDDEKIWTFDGDQVDTVEFVTHKVHDVGETPIIRYANQLDLDGRSDGEVGPFVPVVARIGPTVWLPERGTFWTDSGIE